MIPWNWRTRELRECVETLLLGSFGAASLWILVAGGYPEDTKCWALRAAYVYLLRWLPLTRVTNALRLLGRGGFSGRSGDNAL